MRGRNAGQCIYHTGRSAEYNAYSDEDVLNKNPVSDPKSSSQVILRRKDLPAGTISDSGCGVKVVKRSGGINICTLTSKDVVRHPLVQKIVKAYEDYEERIAAQRKQGGKKGMSLLHRRRGGSQV